MIAELHKWTTADIDKVNLETADMWHNWMCEGLQNWNNPQTTWKAFAPIEECFTVFEDAEFQLSKMFNAMSEDQSKIFVQAIGIGFTTAEPNTAGYGLFDSFQHLTRLIGNPEPLAPMVERICSADFLDNASFEMSRHLFAACLLTLNKFPDMSLLDKYLPPLENSERYLSDYDDYCAKMRKSAFQSNQPT